MLDVIFWSVMALAFLLFISVGWDDIEEWFWLRGARKEIKMMEQQKGEVNER